MPSENRWQSSETTSTGTTFDVGFPGEHMKSSLTLGVSEAKT